MTFAYSMYNISKVLSSRQSSSRMSIGSSNSILHYSTNSCTWVQLGPLLIWESPVRPHFPALFRVCESCSCQVGTTESHVSQSLSHLTRRVAAKASEPCVEPLTSDAPTQFTKFAWHAAYSRDLGKRGVRTRRSEEALDFVDGVEANADGGGDAGEAGHGHHVAADGDDELGA